MILMLLQNEAVFASAPSGAIKFDFKDDAVGLKAEALNIVQFSS